MLKENKPNREGRKAVSNALRPGFIMLSFVAGAAPSSLVPTFVAPGKSLTLAINGQTKYTIVLAADSIPAEQTAAKELQAHL